MFVDLQVGELTEPIGGRHWDRAAISDEVARRIARFQAQGLARGDRVFLPFGNRLEFFAELLALWRLGACAVPVDARLTAFEVTTLVAAASPRLAVVDDATDAAVVLALRDAGVEVVDTTDTGQARVSAGMSRRAAPKANPAARSAQGTPVSRRAAPKANPAARSAQGTPVSRLDDDALILFTSGSTGAPKGVVHTHRSLRARWIALRDHLGVEPFERSLCMLPTHFGHGLICNCLYPWLSGQDLFITPPFRPDIIMRLGDLLDKHRITFMSSVPSVWRMALKLSRRPQQGSLRRVHVGSAPLSASVWEAIREWTGTRQVCNAYGITETGSWVAGLADADVPAEDGLIGQGWGAVVKVLRTAETVSALPADAQCSPGEAGYVWLNTPALMKGYFQRDDLTAQAVVDGWFCTGDIGVIDAQGRLSLRGRERDEINKGGMKIYPADIDAVVERFDAAGDVCSFALDDAMYGQVVGMAVVLRDDQDATVRALHDWMKVHLAEHKMPSRWWRVAEIPRTSRGKINREAVRDACAGQTALDLARLLAVEAGA